MQFDRQSFFSLLSYLAWLALVVVLVSMISCSPRDASSSDTDDLLAKLPKTHTEEVAVTHAQNFTVSYHGDYKLVDLHFASEGRGMDFTQKLVLVQRGAEPPEKSGELADA